MVLHRSLTDYIFLVSVVTSYILLYVSGIIGFMNMQNKLTEFGKNVQTVPALVMKEVDNKYDRMIRVQLKILDVVNRFEGRFAKTNDIYDWMVQLQNIAITIKDIEKTQNELIYLEKNVKYLRSLNDHFRKNQSQLMDNLVDYKHKTDDVLKRLHGLDNDIAMLNDTLNYKAKALEEKTSMLEKRIFKCEQSALNLKTEIDNYENMVTKYRNEVSETVLIPKSTIMLICVIIVVVSLSFCIVYRKERHNSAEMKRKTEYLVQNIGKPTLRWESFLLLDEIIPRSEQELEKKYCIVSFHPDTHHRHIRMVGVCVEARHREKQYEESDFIVTSHMSISNIPYVMVILVFIDYNRQSQILETPGQDSNDIKLLTVKACRKKSNDVFVIYVGDEESRSLMPGLLFNQHLKTVTEHFELKQLEQRDRVLTVYERFTITQREKIAEAIA